MAMKSLHGNGKLTAAEKYKEGDYFTLSADNKKLVDTKAEEICIATRLFSLSSNKKFGGSK